MSAVSNIELGHHASMLWAEQSARVLSPSTYSLTYIQISRHLQPAQRRAGYQGSHATMMEVGEHHLWEQQIARKHRPLVQEPIGAVLPDAATLVLHLL